MLEEAQAYHFMIPKKEGMQVAATSCLSLEGNWGWLKKPLPCIYSCNSNLYYMNTSPRQKMTYKRQAWKYLIADKIEFNMKSII